MKIIKVNESLSNIPHIKTKISLCLGYFDGVHIAHQRLINEARVHTSDKVGIITFSSNIKGRETLTNLENRLNLFKLLNIDYVFIFPFTNKFKNISKEEFKKKFFDKLNIDALYAGKDFYFGKNKSGDIQYLKKYYPVHVVKFLKIDDKKISSFDIAKFIKEGKIKKANKYLGHPYQIKGRVIKGYQEGRKINFPTANIKIIDNFVIPKYGVYKVLVYILGIPRLGIANVGIHPTINKLKEPLLEVHIPRYSNNLYGKELYIEFIDFIRSEKKFKSEKELIKQINKDISKITK